MRISKVQVKKHLAVLEKHEIYTSGREHCLHNCFSFEARLHLLVVPLTFQHFSLGSLTIGKAGKGRGVVSSCQSCVLGSLVGNGTGIPPGAQGLTSTLTRLKPNP
jgi:hypothetical protein